jgi:zinc and cadmium transporter
VSYAVGALLGVALMALLPEALELRPATQVFGTLLAGILGFFVLEKAVLWRHCHTDTCEVHGVSASLVLIGGAVHNFVDGAMIGAAVLTSLPLGISTAAAVAAHEVPQEIGDFAVLLHAGYSRSRALALNVLCGLASVAGAAGAVLLVNILPGMLPYLLAVAASSFLYVAMSDLIPDLHHRGPERRGGGSPGLSDWLGHGHSPAPVNHERRVTNYEYEMPRIFDRTQCQSASDSRNVVLVARRPSVVLQEAM